MMDRVVKTVIESHESFLRLDRWLSRRFTYRTREQWKKLIRNGIIKVNGQTVKAAKKVAIGDEVEYCISGVEEPPVSLEYNVSYEDDQLLVINKPGNLPCHPAGRYFEHSLWFLLKKDYSRFWIVNRLDRETSGIVVVAKSLEAARDLSRQFQTGRVTKKYLVLVEGRFPDYLSAEGVLVKDISSTVRKKTSFIKGNGEQMSSVCTIFRKLQERDGVSLLEVFPKTGRLHQIRATLHSLGYPVVGDKLYGVDDTIYLRFISGTMTDCDHSLLRLNRQALHAFQLTFSHPRSKKHQTISAYCPSDLRSFMEGKKFDLI